MHSGSLNVEVGLLAGLYHFRRLRVVWRPGWSKEDGLDLKDVDTIWLKGINHERSLSLK